MNSSIQNFIPLLFYALTFVSGLFIGSFLNVVADRLSTGNGKSIFFSRSICDHCKKPLTFRDLIPLVSWLSTFGKCRYCHTRLSYYYPLSELLTASAFVTGAYFINIFENPVTSFTWVVFAFLLVLLSCYIVMFLADAKYRVIPDEVVFFAIGLTFLFLIINATYGALSSYYQLKNDDFGKYLIAAGFWMDHLFLLLKSVGYTFISAAAIGIAFLLLTKIKNGQAMGGGDVKLAFLIGLFNGFPNNILAIFLGFLTGAVFSVVLMGLRKKTMKDTIPFGPFLILGSVVALLWGDVLLDWYFGLFG